VQLRAVTFQLLFANSIRNLRTRGSYRASSIGTRSCCTYIFPSCGLEPPSVTRVNLTSSSLGKFHFWRGSHTPSTGGAKTVPEWALSTASAMLCVGGMLGLIHPTTACCCDRGYYSSICRDSIGTIPTLTCQMLQFCTIALMRKM
jgi:hypothetical protein